MRDAIRTIKGIQSANRATRMVALILVMIVMAGGIAPTAAQDEPQEAVADEAPPTEAPPPTAIPPTQPPPPTEAPPPTAVPPTAIPPTEIPAPTNVPPTVPPPTGVPATEAPIATEDSGTPTVEPTATDEPSPTPTEPTESTLSYRLADKPECVLGPNQSPAIASGGYLDYLCTDQVALAGVQVAPAQIELGWTTQASIANGWSVQLLPPLNPNDPAAVWTSAGVSEAAFAFDHNNPVGAAVEPSDFSTTVHIDYRLRVQRATCAIDRETVAIHHGVQVTSPGTDVRLDPSAPSTDEPLLIVPDLQPIPDPAVAFAGPLSFGVVGMTSAGVAESIQSGSLSLTVSGLDQACGTWNVHLSATALTDDLGAGLAGSQLLVTAVNGEALSAGPCDLTTGCDIATLAAGSDAASVQNLNLTLDLHLPEDASLGTFGTNLDATLSKSGESAASDDQQQARDVDP